MGDNRKFSNGYIKDYTREDMEDMLVEIDQPLVNVEDVAFRLCEILSCENCPIQIHNCDTRTDEQQQLAYTCQHELHKWLSREFRNEEYYKNKIK